MKIACVGGGPGGLYAALLLKSKHAEYQVTVLDRNPADATYGWGVVFSDETLGFLQEADPPTYEAIATEFVRWDAIDIHYRDATMRSGGHAFSGLARRTLLRVLQRRCLELGVTLRFEVEIATVSELDDYDLVVAADGANSMLRTAHRDVFKTSFDAHFTRYIWLGCATRFDAFTFAFRESLNHGMFQVHAYPFDRVTSTVIVECAENTWQRAGLDVASEAESLHFCEALFASELGGRALLSNRSTWTRFVTLKNENWHSGKLVLLGDAAHTAHFSIGSGTKMAMEDAIALSAAVEKHRDLDGALVEYEELRQPVVERTQSAARESSRWFENTNRYRSLEPVQFAFSLLTRSKRISYKNLRIRDAQFADRVDRWCVASSQSSPGPIAFPPSPPLSNDFQLRDVCLRNRLVSAPHDRDDAQDGEPGNGHLVALAEQALNGAGLVLARDVAVSCDARITQGSPGLYRDSHAEGWHRVTDFIHSNFTAKAGIQLTHAGRRGATRPRSEGRDRPLRSGGWPLVSASPLPYTFESQVPSELTPKGMEEVREAFVRATRWADTAQFDLLELHMAQGYLLGSFLSPLTNLRTDEYGGNASHRMRFPLELFDAVREQWPAGKPLMVSVSATDWVRGGISSHEVIEFVKALRDRGCDMIHAVTGQTTSNANPEFARAWQTTWSDEIRNDGQIPTMADGNIATSDEVNTIVAAGRADLCLVTTVINMGAVSAMW